MDLLRSCYETDMQFDEAGEIVTRVRWYFCAPGAPIYTEPTVFRSNNYGDIAGGELGPGEVSTSDRPWSDGALLGQPGTPCGQPDWFKNGAPEDAPPLEYVGALPACCSPNRSGQLGVKVGLESKPPCTHGLDWTGAILLMVDAVDGHLMAGPVMPDFSFPSAVQWTIPPPTVFFRWTVQGANQGQGGLCPLLFNIRPTVTGTYTISGGEMGSYAGYPGSLVFKFDDQNFWIHPFYQIVIFGPQHVPGEIGIAVGIVPPNEIGIETGIESTRRAIAHGTVGVLAGLESDLRSIHPVELGVAVGVESATRSIHSGNLGVELGVASALRSIHPAALGVKVGLHSPIPVILGVDVGLVGTLRSKHPAALGEKAGIASVTANGIVTSCCPGRVIPTTLTGTDGLGSFTATWSAVAGGWTFVDPTAGLSWTLTCVNLGGGTFQWRTLGNVGAHCSASYSVPSLTCNPFSVSTHVGITGGSCVTAGSYNFTIHA